MGWRSDVRGHQLISRSGHQGSRHRWTRKKVQGLRSGGQTQRCFKKERMINHVSVSSRSSNIKPKKLTIRFNMQIIATLTQLLSGVGKTLTGRELKTGENTNIYFREFS